MPPVERDAWVYAGWILVPRPYTLDPRPLILEARGFATKRGSQAEAVQRVQAIRRLHWRICVDRSLTGPLIQLAILRKRRTN